MLLDFFYYLLQLSLPPQIVPSTFANIPINTNIANIRYASALRFCISIKQMAMHETSITPTAVIFAKITPDEIIKSIIISLLLLVYGAKVEVCFDNLRQSVKRG